MDRIMKKIIKTSLLLAFAVFTTAQVSAQCGKFSDAAKPDDAETAHVLYRQEVKNKNFDAAYENWMKAYTMAPAADGQRHSHYSDGRKILKHKLKNETDEAKKKELIAQITKLYDEQINCYGGQKGSLVYYLLGRKAFDMFYEFRTPYDELAGVLKESVSQGGNDSEYIVLDPYATVVVYQFTNDKMDKEEARAIYTKLNEIADHNIANKPKQAAYYQQAKDAMNARFAKIENNIFDCEYFKVKLEPGYRADPDNVELVKQLFNKLRVQGCADTDPLMAELKVKYEKWAAETNAAKQADFEANNPAMMASKAYKAGNYGEAVAKYNEAIAGETDPLKQAKYYNSIASIQFRKNKKYSAARESARKAAQLDPSWGKPYALIGDMYAQTARNCGDSWNQRLAIIAAIEKWQVAKGKNLKDEERSSLSNKISRYLSKHLPDKEEAFMRGAKEGSSAKCGCWIGETVKVRLK